MPWTVKNPPSVAKNWNKEEKEKCVKAANTVLRNGGSDEDAIYACIHAAGKGKKSLKEVIESILFKNENEQEKTEE